ncbi:hypothetical protein [Halarsenatibacter silvermanii]|uniref:Uncharacterized protein n=1 Tax=Halarsenatibacter silvermanii TaxID=321763 RepID=A0A1G9KET2_9FIRM|nr:hypothetical protein [Halarsenatibacter silvermanii]SDL48390.1 hypothetical protein SAMN04488692_1054 [Halarsenatibacter silvermanii]
MLNYKLKYILLLASFLMISGWLLALGMVISLMNSTFLKNFISFTLMTAGFLVGMVGVMRGWKAGKSQKDLDELKEKLILGEESVESGSEEYNPYS